ncbi:hypothetical protein SAMN05216605_12345 [Pseudomonas abietaniphila]|uniref:Uncharacterized protein n=1 Tax=Pseudomonas abietaniphila TaxID=89065 RepID=A0A1G8RSX4_9PSED|nr:hypothetical protein SAMN05216605_12345 [Pseudomonas abietaniphila]
MKPPTHAVMQKEYVTVINFNLFSLLFRPLGGPACCWVDVIRRAKLIQPVNMPVKQRILNRLTTLHGVS